MFNAQTFRGLGTGLKAKANYIFLRMCVFWRVWCWGHWSQAAFIADNIVQVISFCPAAQRKEVQARAVFYPLMGLGSAVSMCYRTLYIGTGEELFPALSDSRWFSLRVCPVECQNGLFVATETRILHCQEVGKFST